MKKVAKTPCFRCQCWRCANKNCKVPCDMNGCLLVMKSCADYVSRNPVVRMITAMDKGITAFMKAHIIV